MVSAEPVLFHVQNRDVHLVVLPVPHLCSTCDFPTGPSAIPAVHAHFAPPPRLLRSVNRTTVTCTVCIRACLLTTEPKPSLDPGGSSSKIPDCYCTSKEFGRRKSDVVPFRVRRCIWTLRRLHARMKLYARATMLRSRFQWSIASGRLSSDVSWLKEHHFSNDRWTEPFPSMNS